MYISPDEGDPFTHITVNGSPNLKEYLAYVMSAIILFEASAADERISPSR
jgi:hypothetical protein